MDGRRSSRGAGAIAQRAQINVSAYKRAERTERIGSMSAARGKTDAQAETHPQEGDNGKPKPLGEGHISGNLTADPELRFTPTGRAVAKLRVAYAPRVKDEANNRWIDGEVQYYDIDVWGKQGENCVEYLQRGDRIVAVGEWYMRNWETREGEARTSVTLTARDIGPSMLFRAVSVNRSGRTGPPMGGPPPPAEPMPGGDAQDPPPF